MRSGFIRVMTKRLPSLILVALLLLYSGRSGCACAADDQLVAAAARGDTALVKTLLNGGANVDAKDFRGWTALIAAAFAGEAEVVNLLVVRGAEVNATVNADWTPLLAAAWSGDTETVKVLLDHGADLKREWSRSQDLYPRASVFSKPVFVRTIRFHLNQGTTALKMAIDRGATDVVRVLLDRGVDVNGTTWEGSSLLLWAVVSGRIDMVNLLLEKGAEVNAGSNDGASALACAAVLDRSEIVKELKSHGARLTLSIAAMLGEEKEVLRLIEAGADISARDSTGCTPLMNAVSKGHLST